MNHYIRLSPVASIAPAIGEGSLVAFGVGPDGIVHIAAALKPLDYRSKDGCYAKSVGAQPQTYRVVGMSGPQTVLDMVIEGERFNIHHVQPLPGELLLVGTCACFRAPDDFERNGRVYTLDGVFAREILLGDGIKTVQATSEGVIWTSYFDEGVYGNRGWKKPVGKSGLVAWDSAGNELYAFRRNADIGGISDCYALNVENEEDTWLYYYTQFPLVRLHRHVILSVWNMPVHGSAAFAVHADHALFWGSYEERGVCQLFALPKDGAPNLLAKIEFQDQKGTKLVANRIACRGSAIHVLVGHLVYRIDLPAVLAQLG